MHPTAWHVLRTAPQRELAVADLLKAAGLVPLVPLQQVWRARWLGRRSRRVDDAERPLLASYAFLAAPVMAWRAILETPDVLGVLLSDGRPAVVADAELAELRRMASRAPIRAGDKVAIVAGPFAGQDVVASAVDVDKRSITADVTLLGSRRPVQISVDQLAA